MKKHSLWIGDLLAWLFLTLIGFASHGEFQLAFLPRMMVTFIALAVAWLPLAFLNSLLTPPSSLAISYLLKLGVIVVYTVPLAIVLRAAWLNSAVTPLFALVMTLFSIIGILLWRITYFALFKGR